MSEELIEVIAEEIGEGGDETSIAQAILESDWLAAHDREVRDAVIEGVAKMVEAMLGDRLSNDDWAARIRALNKEASDGE